MTTLNEQTTTQVVVSFQAPNGSAALPLGVTYRIDDVRSGQEIRENTAVTSPASTITITLTPEDMRIVDNRNAVELRVITVRADYGEGDVLHAEYQFRVKNLRYAPVVLQED